MTWFAVEYFRPTLWRARKWDSCPWSGLRFHLEVFCPLWFSTIARRSWWWTCGQCSPRSPSVALEARCSLTAWNIASQAGWEHACPYSSRSKSFEDRNRRKISFSLESFVHKATRTLPRKRWYRYNFLHLETNRFFNLVSLGKKNCSILDEVPGPVIGQVSRLAQNRTASVWWPPFRVLALSPLGKLRPPYSRFPCMVDYWICDLSGSILDLKDSMPHTIRAATLANIFWSDNYELDNINNYTLFRGQFELDDNIDHKSFTKREHLEFWLPSVVLPDHVPHIAHAMLSSGSCSWHFPLSVWAVRAWNLQKVLETATKSKKHGNHRRRRNASHITHHGMYMYIYACICDYMYIFFEIFTCTGIYRDLESGCEWHT